MESLILPITCLLPWDLFEKILGSLDCPHICYHLCRQLCQKTRNELLPRLVDWYFVEWWYPLDQTNNLHKWTTMSCMWKVQSRKHMKTTTGLWSRGGYTRILPIDHIRFFIPFKEGRTIKLKNGTYPIVFQRKKNVESNHSAVTMQLVHTYQSDKYILGGYYTINSGKAKSAFTLNIGDFVLTESGKFKHVMDKGIMAYWVWVTFKNSKHNMHLDAYDNILIF